MKNPIKIAHENIRKFIEDSFPLPELTALYIGATLVLSAALYTVSAGVEGVERLLGAQTTIHQARFNEGSSIEYAFPGAQGTIRAGTFTLEDGRSVQALDNIVVTEGKWLPNMMGLQEGQTYDVKLFGSDDLGFQYLVSAEPVEGKK